jgi:hypothetical protein
MRRTCLTFLAALALTPAARAAVIAPGSTNTVTALNQTFELDSVHDGVFVRFTDVYTFDLPPAVLAANDGRARIEIFLRQNLDGSLSPVAGEVLSGPGLSYTPVPLPFAGGGFTNSYTIMIATPGTYTLTLRGSTAAFEGAGYTGSVSFITPLPATLLLLGVPLGGLLALRRLSLRAAHLEESCSA